MLIVDVGGTYTRLGILEGKRIRNLVVYRSKNFKSFYDLLRFYINSTKIRDFLKEIYLAVAGPVIEDKAILVNLGWKIEGEKIKKRYGFERVFLVNDLFSLALGYRFIAKRYVKTIKKGFSKHKVPKVFIAPGTGLGEAVLLRESPPIVVSTEGGHTFFASLEREEFEFIEFLKEKREELSWEKALSGPALTRWYEFYFGETLSPEQICEKAKRKDKKALKVVGKVLELLGRKASQSALSFLAYGGIYIAGGLIKGLSPFLEKAEFRDRFLRGFLANLKMEYLLRKITVKLIFHPYPVLLGALAIHHNQ